MKLTQEIIDKIQEAMLHTKKDGREEYMKEMKENKKWVKKN